MRSNVTAHFEDEVIPILQDRYADVASAMAIQLRGSYGLGIADKYSDLDAVIWLDDPIWEEDGGKLQLTLENDIPRFVPPVASSERAHAEVNVWPLSWLGDRRQFLADTANPPWEQVSFEDLFEIQRNLVIRDPQGLFHSLKEATRPDRFPESLWRKRLILDMKKLDEHILEYRQVVNRNRRREERIVNGRLVEDILRLGFLVSKQYYPWSTHLRWALSELLEPAAHIFSLLDVVSGTGPPGDRLSAAQEARENYAAAIVEQGLLTDEILKDLVWAERLEAWSNENWRDWIVNCQHKAEAAGHQAKDFWIWSLWGWE